MKKEIKDCAKTNLQKTASSIVEEIMKNQINDQDPEGSRPKQENLVRIANRVRESLRPKEPRDLSFQIAENFLPRNFLLNDISVEEERHLLFATESQLELLEKSKEWYIDSTFKVIRPPFYQLFSVHAFIRSGGDSKMVPLAFCLMSRRKKKDYKKVLNGLLDAMSCEPLVSCIVTDFEPAVWSACKLVLPEVRIRGCVFHFTQAIWRKTQELGLQKPYHETDCIHKFVRKLMALPFLPAEHIAAAFTKLEDSVEETSGCLHDLVTYVSSTWIESTKWPLESWSVFNLPTRTNNDVEGWHHRLNLKARDHSLPFYVLVPLLHTEASLLPLQCKLVSEGKLKRIQKKKTRGVQRKLYEYWGKYEKGEISTSHLLKSCSKLNGPVDI